MVMMKNVARLVASVSILGSVIGLTSPAFAQDAPEEAKSPVTIEGSYKSDVASVVSGGIARGTRWLDNLNLTAGFDLDQLAGWQGGTIFVNVLNNFGGRPNDLVGSIQGVNNIEVGATHLKVYEAWAEQAFGNVTVRAGLYDLNTEFYQNDASGLLISPPFGIGSELSATGPNGPSIFPSTALAGRVNATFGDTYVRAAVLNAKAGTIGDADGMAPFGPEGLLVISELGWTGNGKIAIGAWRYTKEQPVIDAPDIQPAGTTHVSQGIYFTLERELFAKDGGATVSGFVRGGLSDGYTTPYAGGWQAGVLVEHVFASRPASSFSLGAGTALLSKTYRDSAFVAGTPLRKTETIIEATYKDEILPGLSLQPDLQYVINPAADPTIRNALVIGLRVQFDFKLK